MGTFFCFSGTRREQHIISSAPEIFGLGARHRRRRIKSNGRGDKGIR